MLGQDPLSPEEPLAQGDDLLSHHYAYIQTYTSDVRIHFMGLECLKRGLLSVTPWTIRDWAYVFKSTVLSNRFLDPVEKTKDLKTTP